MPQGLPVDRPALHRKMWEAKDRNNKVKIYQKRFAAHVGISAPQMSRIIREFLDEGRLKMVGSGYRNVKTYIVYDPDKFVGSETDLRTVGLGPASLGGP